MKNIIAFIILLSEFTNTSAQQNIRKDTTIHYTNIIDRIPPVMPDSMKVYNADGHIKPKFPEDIRKYLADSTRYPKEAQQKKIQGTVYVSFIIERDGSISNITVLRSSNASFTNEAKRVISTMPKWMPGKKDGVPVRVRDSLPIVFKLRH